MAALRAFLLDRLPAGAEVIQGVVNRVAEPTAPSFATLTLIRAQRLSTNVDADADVKFSASIAPAPATFQGSIAPAPRQPAAPPSGLMAVSLVSAGQVLVGSLVAGAGVADGTYVTAQIGGTPGGAGNYAVSVPQSVIAGPLTSSCGLMAVSSVAIGSIEVGASVWGVGLPPTTVRAALTGAGGAGTYAVGPSQSFGPGTLSAGRKTIRESSIFTVQMDFHGADASSPSDMAQAVSAAFRDAYAVDFFRALTAGAVSPLYADDPRFAPFFDENQQAEWRWIVEANLQVNQTTSVPAQYADAASVVAIGVDSGPPYPP